MLSFLQNHSWYVVWLYICVVFFARYVIIAGIAYLWLWKFGARKYAKWRIQEKLPEASHLWRDFRNSMVSMFLFATTGTVILELAFMGKTRMYFQIDEFGIGYFLFSMVIFLVIHDAYFYWAHRFMHLPGIYQRVHLTHHLSTNPSPWSAFAFHPYETILEVLILPLIIFTIPIHLYAIVIFLVIMTIMNVIGHLGYEMYPAGFLSNAFGRWNNTSTHHNMHHRLVNCNYGLYFNWWDSWMRTNHPDYVKTFDKIKAG